jgi:hypothetical protein
MTAPEHVQPVHDPAAIEALREVQRRVIAIHYGLSEGLTGDREIQHRTLDRLMGLVEYIESIVGAESTGPNGQRP